MDNDDVYKKIGNFILHDPELLQYFIDNKNGIEIYSEMLSDSEFIALAVMPRIPAAPDNQEWHELMHNQATK